MGKDREQERGAGLPPAGDAQRDELKRRTDVLEEKAEQANAEMQGAVGDVALADIPIENEIAQHFVPEDGSFMLKVSDANPTRTYKWVCERLPSGASSLQVERAMVDGWAVVQGVDPECAAKKDARGYRKVGDSILMWISKARHAALEARDRAVRADMYDPDGMHDRLDELGHRHKGVVVVHSDPSDPVLQRAFKRHQAQGMATKQFVEQIKEGVPMGGIAPGSDVRAAR